MEVISGVEEHCSKIKLEDGRDLYFSIKEDTTSSNKRCWNVILTDGKAVWDAEVSEDILSDMAVGSSYTAQQFVNLFKTAFDLREPDSGTILKYTLTAMSMGKDCFFWSIYLPKDEQTFRLGGIDVRPLSESERAPVYCRMFDSLLSVTSKSRKVAELSRACSEEEKKCSGLAAQKLEKYVTVQEQCERVLYTNFVAVLNEKKRKIRELQDQCESLRQTLDVNTTTETVTQEVSNTSTKRSKSAKAASRRSTKPPVSACSAPTRKRQSKKAKGPEYDSDATTDMEEENRTTSKHSKRLIESSDDEATDIDDALETITHTSPENNPDGLLHTDTAGARLAGLLHTDTAGARLETGAEDTQRESPTLEVILQLTRVEENTSRAGADKPVLTAETSAKLEAAPSKAAAEALLDDLLEECKPSTSSKQKSPVRRRAAPRAVQKAAPVAASKARPARKQKTTQSADNDSLIDDLLDGM